MFSDVSLHADAGELLYVRGPNGAGKTSLLRILVGLSEPDEGEVLFRGENITRVPHQFHQSLIYFGHKLGINSVLTPTENLHYWCKQHGVNCSIETLYETLARLELVGLEDVPCGQLSAGQQRRVALARCWLKPDASLWVLDEPFTALDADGIALLSGLMVDYLSRGGCAVVTSHQVLNLPCTTKTLSLEYRI